MEAYQYASQDETIVERLDKSEQFLVNGDSRAARRLANFLAAGGTIAPFQAPPPPSQQEIVDGALMDKFRRALIEELAFRFGVTPLQLMSAVRDRVQS